MTLAPVVLTALATVFPHPQRVICHMPPSIAEPHELGLVYRTDQINVRPRICARANLFFDTLTIDHRTVEALMTIAHEQRHLLTPEAAEWRVQCHAIRGAQRLVGYAYRGAPDRVARMRQAHIIAVAITRGMPPPYQSSCSGASTTRSPSGSGGR